MTWKVVAIESAAKRCPVFSAQELTLEVISVGEVGSQHGETGGIPAVSAREMNFFRQSEGQEIHEGIRIGGWIGHARVVMDLLRDLGRLNQAVDRAFGKLGPAGLQHLETVCADHDGDPLQVSAKSFEEGLVVEGNI
jgi:hypothetical protein